MDFCSSLVLPMYLFDSLSQQPQTLLLDDSTTEYWNLLIVKDPIHEFWIPQMHLIPTLFASSTPFVMHSQLYTIGLSI